ncbi:MAG: bifunctional precorrin-2 dehydrogenase/sirohydrochlorin ferrochelatase [Magnetococcus sp. YQC-5]
MNHYMAELVLTGRRVLVIGGGRVARRKIESLLACGAIITVVAPTLDECVAGWVATRQVSHWPECFTQEILAREPRPWLVFATTSESALNQSIAQVCGQSGLLCNSADDPSISGFLVPAIVRRGGVMVAVGTGGQSPALSRLLKERIDGWLEPGWGALAASFGSWRQRVAARIPDALKRQKFWRESALAAAEEKRLGMEQHDDWMQQQLQKYEEAG